MNHTPDELDKLLEGMDEAPDIFEFSGQVVHPAPPAQDSEEVPCG